MPVMLTAGLLCQAPAFAAPASDGLLRTAIRYDITSMDVAKTTDDYMIPLNVFDRLFETRLVDGSAKEIVSTPKVGMTYLTFNENQEYLKDVNVRKAISMSIDVDMIIASIYNGDAVREQGIIPIGIWGHNDNLEGPVYDPDGAMALLKEAGYKDGEVSFEISVDSSADGNIKLIAQFISQQLKEIDVNANLKYYEHAAWLDLRGSGKEMYSATMSVLPGTPPMLPNLIMIRRMTWSIVNTAVSGMSPEMYSAITSVPEEMRPMRHHLSTVFRRKNWHTANTADSGIRSETYSVIISARDVMQPMQND